MNDDRQPDIPPPEADAMHLPAMPLALGGEGQEVTLAEVRGGRQFLHRMAEMGLTPGTRFRILKKGRPGPFIIALRETRLMLGHAMVHRILVRPT